MINSFCIKSNQNFILEYLLSQLEQTDLDGIYLSKNQFKNFHNVIVHNTNPAQKSKFLFHIANSITNTILALYEPQILKKIIYTNYFYFSDLEKKEILDSVIVLLNASHHDILVRRNMIFTACQDYISTNHSVVLDGFVLFRLQEYESNLDEGIDLAVDKYIIEKEYNEFISLLKLYIASKECGDTALHLIYKHHESILLDSNKQKINMQDHNFDAKYLSDISFSSNDYALNTILNIIPQKLYVHFIDSKEDEFITTLKLIFEDRVQLCHGCSICQPFTVSHKNKSKVTTL